MEAQKLVIEIPGEILDAIRLPPKEMEAEFRKELAVALYQRGALSFGKARILAQMTHWEFHDLLSRRGVECHYEAADLDQDIAYTLSQVGQVPT